MKAVHDVNPIYNFYYNGTNKKTFRWATIENFDGDYKSYIIKTFASALRIHDSVDSDEDIYHFKFGDGRCFKLYHLYEWSYENDGDSYLNNYFDVVEANSYECDFLPNTERDWI